MKLKFLTLFVSLILLGACSDDDKSQPETVVSLESIAYPVNQGTINGWAALSNYLVLTNSDGSNHSIRLIFVDLEAIPNGTYTLMPNDNPDFDPERNFPSGTITRGNDTPPIDMVSGSVRISRHGSKYKIKFDVETQQGHLHGTFNGPIVVTD